LVERRRGLWIERSEVSIYTFMALLLMQQCGINKWIFFVTVVSRIVWAIAKETVKQTCMQKGMPQVEQLELFSNYVQER
jgi:hypothetical protein